MKKRIHSIGEKLLACTWPGLLFGGITAFALPALSRWLIQKTVWGDAIWLLFVGAYVLGFRVAKNRLEKDAPASWV